MLDVKTFLASKKVFHYRTDDKGCPSNYLKNDNMDQVSSTSSQKHDRQCKVRDSKSCMTDLMEINMFLFIKRDDGIKYTIRC